jgi:hypothetical protein
MLSVTCTQCNAHYTMSEELYRRKGGGQAVIVTCKRCKAEIRFDATSVAQDKPTHRSLPKPKVAVSKALESGDESGPFVALSSGFFGPEMVAATSESPSKQFPKLPEIESSLDSAIDSAAVQPFHVSSPAAAKNAASKPAAPPKPSPQELDDEEAMSVRSTDMLDESVTVPLAAPKPHGTGTIRRFPAPPPPRRKGEGEHEPLPPPRRMVDEEIEAAPPSSSGTPTLTTLMGESTASNAPKAPTKKADDFLLSLSASPQAVLGPPTIDLSSIGAPNVEGRESVPPAEGESESEPPPSTLGSVAPSAKNAPRDPQGGKKKRRTASRSGTPSARPSSRPSADGKRNQPSNASVPVAKSAVAEQRERPQRSIGLWIGVVVLIGLVIGAVLFKSPKKEQVVAQNDPPPSEPVATVAPVQPTAAPTAEPVATASASPEPPAPSLEKKDKAPEAKTSEPKPSTAEGKEPAPEPAAKEPAAAEKPAEKPAEATATATVEPPAAQHGPFQAAVAKTALAEAAAQAAACRKGDDPAGNAAVIITFAPSGRVTSATLNGPPFAGTATGGCIASTMRRAKVPPFDGDKITVSKTIYVQ